MPTPKPARAQSKQSKIMQHLAQEGPQVVGTELNATLQALTGQTATALAHTLSSMQFDGFIVRKMVLTPAGLEHLKRACPEWERLQ